MRVSPELPAPLSLKTRPQAQQQELWVAWPQADGRAA
jgi:hypothetical protein